MPDLPLPVGETWIGGGDLPVSDSTDVLKEFSTTHRRPEKAPVRDAFAEGYTEGFLEYQNAAAYAAAQSDPMRATGEYLKSFAEEHQVVPRPDESEESVRLRLFRAPQIVTPEAILEGVREILDGYDPSKVTMSELELDGWFVHDGDGTWDSFVGDDPDYPDRYYEDLPYRRPGGAVPSDGYPRAFVLHIPNLTGPNASALYEQIIGFVESVKGQGISWSLIVG